MGPTLLLDKSAMQSLSGEEYSWVTHFFHINITPVLLAEIHGNLAKSFRGKRDPGSFVAAMASRLTGLGTYHNVHFQPLMRAALMGNPVSMTRRTVMGGAKDVVDANGERGVFFDISPESEELRRWSGKRFTDRDRNAARTWRERATGQAKAPKGVIDRLSKDTRPTMGEALAATDVLLNMPPYWRLMTLAFSMADLDGKERAHCKKLWAATGRKPLKSFAPYAWHVLRATFARSIAEDFGLIEQRSSNHIDEEYLYYLPFTEVFSSNDKLHEQLAPWLMASDQWYLPGKALKEAGKALVEYYQKHETELARVGRMAFARYPPLDIETPVHSVWDKAAPGWRAEAAKPPPPRITKEQNDALMAKLKPMWDAMDRARKG